MNLLIANRNYLLAAAAITVLCAIPVSERLQFDQRIESFFADDHPDLQLLRHSRQVFGGDEFVVVAWTEPRLFRIDTESYPQSLHEILETGILLEVDPDAAQRMRSLAEKLNQVPGVNAARTQHLADILDESLKYPRSRIGMLRLFEGTLVGEDGRTTAVMLELLPEAKVGYPRGETLRRIREIAAALPYPAAVAGEPVQVFDMFRLVEEDSRVLFLVSLTILSVVLLMMFHGLRWLLAPIGLVLGSVVVTRATLVLSGARLSMVSSMLNSLVTVIGIATCMHVIVHYRDLRREAQKSDQQTPKSDDMLPDAAPGRNVFAALAAQTLRDMGAPIFWTCVTTAVGFGSLLVSQITPVRSFSIMMCLATGVVLAGCFFVLPATLASGSRLRIPGTAPLESWLDRALLLNSRTVEQRPVLTGVVCGLLFAVSVPGVFLLTVETDFSRNFRESSDIVRSLKFIESRLGGAGSWEVSFNTPPKLTDRFLRTIQKLTDRLRSIADDDNTMTVLSLTDIADLPPRILGPAKTIERIRRRHALMVNNFHNTDAQRMRIILRSREQQPSEEKLRQIQTVRETVAAFFAEQQEVERRRAAAAGEPLPQFTEDRLEDIRITSDRDAILYPQAETAGLYILLAGVIQSLLSDQMKSFLVATIGILVCMTIAFRSLRIGLLSLFPNVFPVALVMGILGWLGSRVNIGTAMITSVSMGLTVDSTIHYITAFERARRKHGITEALHIAHASAGRAVVFAHLALIAGFLVLTASRFIPLVYFGALLTLSLIGGVFGDLVLLPLLLRWTTPRDHTTTIAEGQMQSAQTNVSPVTTEQPAVSDELTKG